MWGRGLVYVFALLHSSGAERRAQRPGLAKLSAQSLDLRKNEQLDSVPKHRGSVSVKDVVMMARLDGFWRSGEVVSGVKLEKGETPKMT